MGTDENISGRVEDCIDIDCVSVTKSKDDLVSKDDSDHDSGIGSPESATPSELPATSSNAPSAAAVPTMVFQISEMYTKVTVHLSDGTLRPVKFKNKDNPTLMCLGFLMNQVFVYGESVKLYADRAKENSRIAGNAQIWCIAQWLMVQNCKGILNWNGEDLESNAELLVGVYFQHLKKRVESKIKATINRVVICVPLWYGAVQRQRLKGAAFVAGFHEAFVVNEARLAAVIHLKWIDSLPRTSSTHALVLDENAGNIDLTFYTRKSSGGLKMIASVGNLQPSSNLLQQMYQKSYENYKRQTDPTSLSLKEQFLERLVKELEQELEQQGMKQLPQDIEVVLFCEDQRWKVMLDNVTKRRVSMYMHLGGYHSKLQKGTAFPKVSLPELIGSFSTDLLALPLYRTDLLYTQTCVKLADDHVEAKDGTLIKTVLRYPSSETYIYQQDGLGNCFRIGFLEISRIKMFKYHTVQINLLMGKDGCLQLHSIFGCNIKGVKIYRLRPSDFKWIPVNATLTELTRFKMIASKIQVWGYKYPSILELAREEVCSLAEKVADLIWEERFKKRTKSSIKCRIDTRVSYILDRARGSFVPLAELTLEEIKSWTTELERYKSQYFV